MNCVLSSWISSMIRAGSADTLSMNENYESRLWIIDLTTGDSIIVIFQKGMIIGGDSCSFYKTEKISNDHAIKIEICFSIYFWIQDAMLLPQPSSKGNSSKFYGPPIAVENLSEDTAHFHILNDRLGSDPENFDSLFVLRPRERLFADRIRVMFGLYSESKCPCRNSRKIFDPNCNDSFSVWFAKVIVCLPYSDQSWKYSLDRNSLYRV